jgi:hypothetical protein
MYLGVWIEWIELEQKEMEQKKGGDFKLLLCEEEKRSVIQVEMLLFRLGMVCMSKKFLRDIFIFQLDRKF